MHNHMVLKKSQTIESMVQNDPKYRNPNENYNQTIFSPAVCTGSKRCHAVYDEIT